MATIQSILSNPSNASRLKNAFADANQKEVYFGGDLLFRKKNDAVNHVSALNGGGVKASLTIITRAEYEAALPAEEAPKELTPLEAAEAALKVAQEALKKLPGNASKAKREAAEAAVKTAEAKVNELKEA